MMIRLSGGIVFSTDCQFRHEQKPHTGLHGVIITEPLLEQLSRFRAKEWKIFSWPGQTLAERIKAKQLLKQSNCCYQKSSCHI